MTPKEPAMTDVTDDVERLRLLHDWHEERGLRYHAETAAQAADTLHKMREALERIAAWEAAPETEQGNKLAYSVWSQLTGIARKALGGN